MTKLLYHGHGSFRIRTDDHVVIYVDPYAGEGYDLPADIVLVTHEHFDHNNLSLVKQNAGCTVLRAADMLSGGSYRSTVEKGVSIRAVPAYSHHHDVASCVGYLLAVDNLKLYAAGDTAATEYMRDVLSHEKIDYALLPIDGIYTMDAAQASQCAAVIGAKHTIPIHMKPGALFDEKAAQAFKAAGRLILRPAQEIEL